MAETTTDPRVFSEDELLAIASDRVARETAGLQAKVDELTASNTELGNKLDAEIVAREAAEKRAEEAETKHAEHLAAVEAEKAATARKDERVAKVKEVASHLSEKFFDDEARITRIVAMDDEHFEGYLADLKDAAAATDSSGPPRETAMAGSAVTPKGPDSAIAARNFMMRTFVAPEEG